MAQSTRTPTAVQRVRPPGAVGWVVGGLVLLGGAGIALARGAGVGLVVVAALLAVAVGTAVLLLPRRWALAGFFVALVVGAGVLARVDRASTPAWIGGAVLGLFLGLQLAWRRQQRSAPDAQPPAHGDDGGRRRLVVEEGADDVETTDPTDEVVRRAAESLDGRTRTGLSVFRGSARLDLGGTASGALVVFQSDDTSARRPRWWTLAGSTSPDPAADVEVRVAGLDAHLPADAVTDARSALTAVDDFLRTGGRAGGLPWRTGDHVDALREPFDRWA